MSHLTIMRNGEPTDITPQHSLQSLLLEWGYEMTTIAVALNQVFIPRAEYANIQLKSNDCIDIVSAMQGG